MRMQAGRARGFVCPKASLDPRLRGTLACVHRNGEDPHEPVRSASRQDAQPGRIHRRPRPEWRQHAQGPPALRHSRRRLVGRGRDVRPRPSDADADHHEPRLRRQPDPGRDPLREHHGPRDRGTAHRRVSLGGEARRSHPQGRQGPGGGGGGRPAHEADSGARCAARSRSRGEGHLRDEDALGHQAGESERDRGRSRAAVRDRASDRRGGPRPDHRARGRHPLPEEGRGRGAAEDGDPRAAGPSRFRSARDAEAHAARGRRSLHGVHRA